MDPPSDPHDCEFIPSAWYWLRHPSGHIAPYRLHQVRKVRGQWMGEFFVGSMVTTWSLGRVVGRAEMPKEKSR